MAGLIGVLFGAGRVRHLECVDIDEERKKDKI